MRQFGFAPRMFGSLTLVSLAVAAAAAQESGADAGAAMKTAPGLRCSVAAGDSLVHDAFSMTTDPAGRPVVSGPGYVRTLLDDDGDGRYDRGVDWAAPRQGAQGMWREGNQLLYVADGGLWRSTDRDGDLRGDGGAEQLLRLPTGNEHDAHAIRRGPDGWWYLTAGNFAMDAMRSLLNDPASPVQEPRGGAIWRISPDFRTRGVWAHGLRNTYDFDFLPGGEIVTCDSDEESELSLPAYRPTRVLVAGPGSDGGWVSTAWIDPPVRLAAPATLATLGRGSPTGVCVYNHDALGRQYRGAAVVLDWTFGRVVAVFPEPTGDGGSWSYPGRCRNEVILEPGGAGGFAPTDVCVAPNGDLLIITGGRGTAGTLYRLSPADSPAATAQLSDAPERLTAAIELLEAPCPFEAWSIATWRPQLTDAAAADLLSLFAGDGSAGGDADSLMRAAQLLAYTQRPVPAQTLRAAIESDDAARAAAGWYLAGRGNIAGGPEELRRLEQSVAAAELNTDMAAGEGWDGVLGDRRVRAACEAIGLRRWSCPSLLRDKPPGSDGEGGERFETRRSLRRLAAWAASRMPPAATASAVDASPVDAFAADVAQAAYPVNSGASSGYGSLDAAAFDRLAVLIRGGRFRRDPVEIVTALAFIRGELGEAPYRGAAAAAESASILDGYTSRRADKFSPPLRAGWSNYLLNAADHAGQQGWPAVEQEAVRTVASFRPSDAAVLSRLLSRITLQSDPTADLNVLCVIAASEFRPDDAAAAEIAAAYAAVPAKLDALDRPTESNWSQRRRQLFDALVRIDPRLADRLIAAIESGVMASADWVEWLPLTKQRDAATAMNRRLLATGPERWTAAQLRLAGRFGIDPALAPRLREVVLLSLESPLPKPAGPDLPPLRCELSTLVAAIAKSPTTADYPVLLRAAAAHDPASAQHGWSGLRKLPNLDPAAELDALAVLAAANERSPVEGVKLEQLATRARDAASRLKLASVPLPQQGWEAWKNFFAANLRGEAVRRRWDMLTAPPAPWADSVERSELIAGDAALGASLFERGKCIQCHNSSQAVGPSLSGVTRRFSYRDLFIAIYEPDRDVSDRYAAVKVLTEDDAAYVGMVRSEDDTTLTLQLADGTVVELSKDEIDVRQPSGNSLMPEGLLQGWEPRQLADLHAYLRELK